MKGVEQSESIYVASTFKKLTPSWSKFAEGLAQKSDQFSLDDLFSALTINDKHCFSKNQKTKFKAKTLTIEGFHKLRPNKFKKNGPKRFFWE